uniref:Uncharacterized protein n=1 Tax=Anguilla anguilla TaxID=7936 RepID=A0A0E9RE91_ANGAN
MFLCYKYSIYAYQRQIFWMCAKK